MTLKPGQYVTAKDVTFYPNRHTVERDGGPTKVLVTGAASWEWAITQRPVGGGWLCIATGTLDGPPEMTHEDVAQLVSKEYGDGFAYLPRDRFRLNEPEGEMIHILRVGGNDTYCGSTAANQYEDAPGKYQQHHTECTDAYRAEHYGRCPLMEHGR